MKNQFRVRVKKLLSVGICFALCMTVCLSMTFKASAAFVYSETILSSTSYTVSKSTTYRFHVIGKGGNGGKGGSVNHGCSSSRIGRLNGYGGASGSTGAYAIHEVFLTAGQVVTVTVSSTQTSIKLPSGATIYANAGVNGGTAITQDNNGGGSAGVPASVSYVTASGGNILNLSGASGMSGGGPTVDHGGSGANAPVISNTSVIYTPKTAAKGGIGGYSPNALNYTNGIPGESARSNAQNLGGAGAGGGGSSHYCSKTTTSTGGASVGGSGGAGGVVVEFADNTAPTTPGTIIAPTSVNKWQTSTVNYSWGASTDLDGDTITYAIEYAINDSDTFIQITTTTATSYSLIIPESEPSSIRLRVKAKDSSGDESAYSMSDWTTINYESQPTDPTDSDKLSVYLDAGDKVKLCVTDDISDNIDFTWSSDDDSVATVNARGVVIGVSAGLCNIIAQDSSGFQQSISIRVEGSESGGEVVYAKVNDDDTKIVYGGIWLPYSGDSAFYNRDEHYSNEVNAYAEFSFNGTAIRWIGANNSDNGKCDVYVDGVLEVQGLDLYSSSLETQKILFSKSGLTNREHTIKVVVTGEKNDDSSDCYVTIDAFEYDSQA